MTAKKYLLFNTRNQKYKFAFSGYDTSFIDDLIKKKDKNVIRFFCENVIIKGGKVHNWYNK
jgi:hypothetical protein